MGTKNNPGNYDCYHNAEPDEPMFILLGRDATAPALVRIWAEERHRQIKAGQKPESDQPMVAEALACADAMEEYRQRRLDREGTRPITTQPGVTPWTR